MDATDRKSWVGVERMDRRPASRILVALLTLALAPASALADGTWDGGGADANWATVGNWTGDAVTFGADQVITFYNTGAARLTNFLGAARTVGTLAFNAGADRDMKIRLTSTAGGTAGRILTFDVTAGDAALTVASGAAGDIEIGVAGATINLNDNLLVTHDGSGELWISAGINGAAKSITKSGSGLLTLSNVTNTFSGGFTLNAGRVRVGSDRALGDGAVVLNGGMLSGDSDIRHVLTNDVTFGGDLVLGHGTNNGTVVFLGAGTLTGSRVLTVESQAILAGALGDGGGGFSLTKAGASALTLGGTNTYSGGTAVNDGILNFASQSAKPAAGAVTVGANGGLGLGVKAADANYWTTADIDSLWGGALAGFTLDPAFKLVGIDTSAGDVTYSTSQSTRGLAKFGDNILTLDVANTFTGGTFIHGGTLRMGHADAIAAGTVVTVYDGAFDPNGQAVDMTVRVNNDTAFGAGTLVLNGGEISAVGITNARTVVNNYQVDGNFTFGDAAESAPLTVSGAGTLTGTRTLTVDSVTTLSGAIGDGAGGYGLVKTGAGTLFLTSADSSYGGVTTVEQGRLSITTNALGTTAAGTVVKSGASLFVSQVNLTLEEPLTLTGTGTGTGGNTFGALILNRNTGTWTLNGAIALDGGAALNCYNAGLATVMIPNGIAGTGDLTLRSSAANNGNATYFLQGPSSYTGDTILSALNAHSNTVVLQVNNALPVTTVVRLQAPSQATPKPTVTLTLNGFNQEVAGIEASAIEVNATNRIVGGSATLSTLTVSNAADFTYGGRIGDSRPDENNLALIKRGAGTLTLTFGNTYAGATTVEAGTLRIHGAHAGGGLITVTGGTLGGTGSVGAVAVGPGGTLAPGASIGMFTATSLTLDGGATLAWELDDDGATADLLVVSGALTRGAAGAWAFDFLGTGAVGSYTLITFGSTDFADGDFVATNLKAGLTGDVNVNATDVTLTVVPEPASLGVLGLLAAAALLRRRRR
jgi:autotransporter-associated beta strand protein